MMFKKWLEFQFHDGMTWQNYGSLWTVDHILPLSAFDFTNEAHQKIAFNWKNTQPSIDNFKKSAKIRPYEYFNALVSAHRYIQLNSLDSTEYQGINESLRWLREKLRYGKNLLDDVVVQRIITKMGNPQPSS